MTLHAVTTLPARPRPAPLLDTHAAAKMLGVNAAWLVMDRHRGSSIPFMRVGRFARYRLADLEAYISRHLVDAEDAP